VADAMIETVVLTAYARATGPLTSARDLGGRGSPGTLTRAPLARMKGTRVITLAEHIAAAQRELAVRKACDPAWTRSGKRDAGDARYQLLCQQAMVRTLMRMDAEQRQLSLFGPGHEAVPGSDGLFVRDTRWPVCSTHPSESGAP
jgi:hypothetical protein